MVFSKKNELEEQKKEIEDYKKEFDIIISPNEWKEISSSISGDKRKKFLVSSNEFFSNKLRSSGFECIFKIKTNSFSSAKKDLFGHNFWNGVFKCKNCNKEILSFIRIRPREMEKILLSLNSNDFKCFDINKNENKIRISGTVRENIQYEIVSKGVANFRNEALIDGKLFFC